MYEEYANPHDLKKGNIWTQGYSLTLGAEVREEEGKHCRKVLAEGVVGQRACPGLQSSYAHLSEGQITHTQLKGHLGEQNTL